MTGPLAGLKLGLVTQNPLEGMGGVERFSSSLVGELRKRGAEVRVWDLNSCDLGRSPFDRFGQALPHAMWRLGKTVAEALGRDPVDLIIQNGISGWPLRRLAAGVPRLVVHHGTWRGVSPHLPPPDASLKRRLTAYALIALQLGSLEKWTCRGARSVAVSRSTQLELQELYGLPSTLIQNGVDLRTFAPSDQDAARAALGLDGDKVVAMYAGRLDCNKGYGAIMEMARRARDELPGLEFLLCCDREPQDAPGNVRAMVNVPHRDMPRVYAASDMLLFPSRYEGCSFTVIEAMASGLPPLMAMAGHARDVAEEERSLAPFILRDKEGGSWWSALARLAADDALRASLGAAARRYAEAHNSLAAMGDAYERVILEQLNGGAA